MSVKYKYLNEYSEIVHATVVAKSTKWKKKKKKIKEMNINSMR